MPARRAITASIHTRRAYDTGNQYEWGVYMLNKSAQTPSMHSKTPSAHLKARHLLHTVHGVEARVGCALLSDELRVLEPVKWSECMWSLC